jgi:hypothetical protein
MTILIGKFIRLLPIFFILNSKLTFAQIWDNVVTTKVGTAYLIDPSSILKTGDIVNYTQLINYQNGYDSGNEKIYSIQQVKQIDCSKNLIKTISMIGYEQENSKGMLLSLSVGREYKWMKINENSISGHYRDEVCR